MRRLAMVAFAATLVATVFRVCHLFWVGPVNSEVKWISPTFALIFLLIFLIWSQSILLMLNERHTNQLLSLARLDALTGVLNRAGFRELARPEIERCRHNGQQLWLLLFDLDHFKRVNDTYGHEAGDLLLRAFVATARATSRTSDLISRHGGEEFCLLLPDCSKNESVAIAELVRERFQTVTVTVGDHQVGTTVSVGIAELDSNQEPLRRALRRADKALYAAKRQGRNRFVLADGRSESRQGRVHEQVSKA
jgi:diguanylate cyclase (GGDEF)-like protein